jgi:ATP-dependent DNA helicase RecG
MSHQPRIFISSVQKELAAERRALADFNTRYIEKAGSGTLDMIARCRAAGLPEPDFDLGSGQFVITLWRDWLADALMSGLNLNERQTKALAAARADRQLTNARYQAVTGTTRATAKRDLEDLVRKGLLARAGSGRGASYRLTNKRPLNGPNGSLSPSS